MSPRDPGASPPGSARNLSPTRRDLLRTGGLAVSLGLAGCLGGNPRPSATVEISVRDPFPGDPNATDGTIAVPIAATLTLRTIDTTDGALEGVELVALDDDREVLATATLGEFTPADPDPDGWRNSTYDDGLVGSTGVYRAEWTCERTIQPPAVPAWLTVDVDGVRFGEESLAVSTAQVVGRAAAAPPPPHLAVSARRLQATPPLPATVRPDHYRSANVMVWRGDVADGPFLPSEDRRTPARSPTSSGTD